MTREPRSLANEVVAITGVARGIGHATARALSSRGARVAIGDLDSVLSYIDAGERAACVERIERGKADPPGASLVAVPPPTPGEEGQSS
jgi:NAD(P)-dependent dehydrogenase (short-subunit alcohol dehydrogenase family)